jgi:hypothetical protein
MSDKEEKKFYNLAAWHTLDLMRSKYTMICKLLKLETVEKSSKEISW